jgi:hypothetical protein
MIFNIMHEFMQYYIPTISSYLQNTRYMGWITNFVNGRQSPSQSMINAYSRYSFVRRISTTTRENLLESMHEVATDWKMSKWMQLYSPPASSQGVGSLAFTLYDGNSRKTELVYKMRQFPYYEDVQRFICMYHNLQAADFKPVCLTRAKAGVKINARAWTVGAACIFFPSNSTVEMIGSVKEMQKWDMAAGASYFILLVSVFEVASKSKMGGVYTCGRAKEDQWISWKQLSQFCKVSPLNNTLIVRVDSTRPCSTFGG